MLGEKVKYDNRKVYFITPVQKWCCVPENHREYLEDRKWFGSWIPNCLLKTINSQTPKTDMIHTACLWFLAECWELFVLKALCSRICHCIVLVFFFTSSYPYIPSYIPQIDRCWYRLFILCFSFLTHGWMLRAVVSQSADALAHSLCV